LHTNNAISAASRLLDMGIEPFLLSSVLEGVLAQRLGRRVCKYCKAQVPVAEEVTHRLTPKERAMFAGNMCVRGRGCDKCGNQGMRGRLGFYELVLMTPSLRQSIARRENAMEMAKHTLPSFVTMRRDGIIKAAEGITTIEEVLRATQDADEGVNAE
jgi:type II secretory ATPase GspE/PulE/Tfp pilus assembly ATPase PilB-like protein